MSWCIASYQSTIPYSVQILLSCIQTPGIRARCNGEKPVFVLLCLLLWKDSTTSGLSARICRSLTRFLLSTRRKLWGCVTHRCTLLQTAWYMTQEYNWGAEQTVDRDTDKGCFIGLPSDDSRSALVKNVIICHIVSTLVLLEIQWLTNNVLLNYINNIYIRFEIVFYIIW